LIVVWLVRALMQQHDTIQASRLCDRKTQARRAHNRALHTANCIRIAQFPIENHSGQGQSAELPLKTIGKSAKFWSAIIMQFAVGGEYGSIAVLSLSW
jgi:hypothetical protein